MWFVVPLFRHLVPFFRDNMQDLKSFHLSVVCPRYDLILDWVLWVMWLFTGNLRWRCLVFHCLMKSRCALNINSFSFQCFSSAPPHRMRMCGDLFLFSIKLNIVILYWKPERLENLNQHVNKKTEESQSWRLSLQFIFTLVFVCFFLNLTKFAKNKECLLWTHLSCC